MTEDLLLTIPSSLDQLDRITTAVEEFGERDDWPPDLVFKVNLVLEELGVNVVKHGVTASAIEVALSSDADTVTVVIADDGPPFNPLTEAPEPRIGAPLEELPIGGLGIHFVRQLMDELHYSREDGKNRLTMVKRKTEEAPEDADQSDADPA